MHKTRGLRAWFSVFHKQQWQSTMGYKDVHVMLDLETLSLAKNAVVTRIAAVEFDLVTGETGEEIDILVNARSCVEAGLKIDASTLEWWLRQDVSLIKETLVPAILEGAQLRDALEKFTAWINALKKTHDSHNILVWGNGACADNTWMMSAYKACDMEVPWRYYHDRDLRTLVYLGEKLTGHSKKRALKFEGERHNPIHDCKHQITYASEIMRDLMALKEGKPVKNDEVEAQE